ncbi:MAG: hypothetical protein ABL962_12430 [Fimbriimonadaceae bacterium]
MSFTCDSGETFADYREIIAISDGNIRCCESQISIPEGQPYAHCQGHWNGEWNSYPQAIEVWRWARNNNRNTGDCFDFEGIDMALDDLWKGDYGFMHKVRWISLVKRIRARYAAGRGPKLNKYELASLMSGEWADWISWHDGQGKCFTYADGSRKYNQPNCPFGKSYVPDVDIEEGVA